MKEHVKIQINSLEALERLIGGDSQLEVEIRGSIVQDFTRRHLKALVNDDLINKAKRELHDELGSSYGYLPNQRFQLNEAAKTVVRDTALRLLDDYIRRIIANDLRERLSANLKLLEDTFERQTEIIATSLTDANIEYRLNEMVEKRIKEKLGLK